MDNRRVSATSNAASITSSVNTFKTSLNSRVSKEKLSPALKQALTLLNLTDLSALEHHFLGTVAFLKPWSYFRDSCLLVQPGTAPRSSALGRIRAVDILWFYTNFSDGELRYDPRADDNTSLYTTDETKYGDFDTTHWGVEDHEKMLYSWLLQEFKVGKARNPFGFDFFECLNICTAWRKCFIPIVEAVQESYDTRGRRYYGRLARFLEEKHPSRVAFPTGNLATPTTPNPYRVISYGGRGAVTNEHAAGSLPLEGTRGEGPITKKQETDLENELRAIESKYGKVAEKSKWRPAEFFATQKARMKQKNLELQEARGALFGRGRSGRESPMFGCIGVDDPRVLDPAYYQKGLSGGSTSKRSSTDMPPSPGSVIKRSSLKERGRVPVGMYGFAPAPNPLNGVTRPLEVPGVGSGGETEAMITHLAGTRRDNLSVDAPIMRPQPSFTRPKTGRKASDGVYSSIRNSNPFLGEGATVNFTPQHQTTFDVLSPMSGHPSAIPKALFDTTQRRNEDHSQGSPSPPSHFQPNQKPTRRPSYSGTGYDHSPTPSFIASKLNSTVQYDSVDQASAREPSSFLLSEIPEVATPPLQRYESPLPTALPWPGFTPALSPDPINWPGFTPSVVSPTPTGWPLVSAGEDEEDEKPPVPPKHPARAASIRNSDSLSSLAPPPPIPGLLGPRIVSKENIRGHLSNISRDISDDRIDVVRRANTSTPRLTPFNKNMFPRRQDRDVTPVGWMSHTGGDHEHTDGYEMTDMKEQGKRE